MSIYRDEARGTYYVVVRLPRDGQGRQRETTGARLRHEEGGPGFEVEALQEAKPGRAVLNNRLTFGDFLTGRWLRYIDSSDLKPATRTGYRSMVADLAPLGHVPLAQLSGDHLSGLYADLRKAGYKPRTVQYVHTTARRALKDAKRWRLVNANVALDADRPARPRPNPQAWSAGQARRYLAVARHDRWAALWVMAIATGLRRGELAGLQWKDLDLDAATVTVSRNRLVVSGFGVVEGTTKNSRARRIALDRSTVTALRAWQAQQEAAAGCLRRGLALERRTVDARGRVVVEAGRYLQGSRPSRRPRSVCHGSRSTRGADTRARPWPWRPACRS